MGAYDHHLSSFAFVNIALETVTAPHNITPYRVSKLTSLCYLKPNSDMISGYYTGIFKSHHPRPPQSYNSYKSNL